MNSKKNISIIIVILIIILGAFYFSGMEDMHSENDNDDHGHENENSENDEHSHSDFSQKETALAIVDTLISDYEIVATSEIIENISQGFYVDGQVYAFALENEIIIAHPNRKDLENTNITELVDISGFNFGEALALSTEEGTWTDYVFTLPESAELADKSTYCQKVDSYIFCAGYYEG